MEAACRLGLLFRPGLFIRTMADRPSPSSPDFEIWPPLPTQDSPITFADLLASYEDFRVELVDGWVIRESATRRQAELTGFLLCALGLHADLRGIDAIVLQAGMPIYVDDRTAFTPDVTYVGPERRGTSKRTTSAKARTWPSRLSSRGLGSATSSRSAMSMPKSGCANTGSSMGSAATCGFYGRMEQVTSPTSPHLSELRSKATSCLVFGSALTFCWQLSCRGFRTSSACG